MSDAAPTPAPTPPPTPAPTPPPTPAPTEDPTTEELLHLLRDAGCVFAEQEAELLLAEFTGAALRAAVRRRVGGQPLEHVLGWARFGGLRITVRAPVFIPRSRAEPLARAAVAEVAARPAGSVVLDLGCGSGAIAATVATAPGTDCQVWASDLSAAAVSCARVNAAVYGFRVVRGDGFSGLPDSLAGRLDVVVGYLPHVPDHRLADVPADYRAAEDEMSLRGGPDGLDTVRTVVAALDRWLAPAGVLLTLVAREQLDAARTLLREAGWSSALVVIPAASGALPGPGSDEGSDPGSDPGSDGGWDDDPVTESPVLSIRRTARGSPA